MLSIYVLLRKWLFVILVSVTYVLARWFCCWSSIINLGGDYSLWTLGIWHDVQDNRTGCFLLNGIPSINVTEFCFQKKMCFPFRSNNFWDNFYQGDMSKPVEYSFSKPLGVLQWVRFPVTRRSRPLFKGHCLSQMNYRSVKT